jgi:hypothetical protein
VSADLVAQRLEWSEGIAESLEDYTDVLQSATPQQLQEAKEVITQVAEAATAFLNFYNSSVAPINPI